MKLFVILLFKFILIYNCVCFRREKVLEDYYTYVSKDPFMSERHPKIILIDNERNHDRNIWFQLNVNDVVTKVVTIDEIYPGGVNGTIIALGLYPHSEIVNLDVDDFYQFDYNYIINNGLYYAGDIGDGIKTFSSYVIDMNETEHYTGDIKIKNQTLRSVKLFSNRGILDQSVYDYIYNFQDDSSFTIYPNIPRTIFICFHNYKRNKDEIMKLTDFKEIKFEFTNNCKRDIKSMQHNILAVITPEPVEMDEEVPFPIILCSNPFTQLLWAPYQKLTTLTSSNPNQVFKIALIQFMKKVGWQRIVILSDNYDYSMEFESSLISIFDEESVMYTVFRCEENLQGNYNFMEILKTLEKADARIIILNIDEKNLKMISDYIQHLPYLYNNCVWILRDGLRGTNLQNIGTVITINLAPAINESISDRVNLLEQNTMNKFKIKSILESVSRVKHAYRYNSYDDDSFVNVYRNINDLLRKTSETEVYIIYQFRNNDPVVLASILFDDIRIIKEKYTLSARVYIEPDMQECAIRSRNYFKPCNYFELIYLMFVLVVFFPTFFTIIIFFTDKNVIYGRRNYRNL